MFNHLVGGDGDSAERHREFYDEYLAVMDLDAAYYMQTVETVFIRHALPKGEMRHRAMQVPAAGMPFGPTLLPTIFRDSAMAPSRAMENSHKCWRETSI